MPAAWTLNGRKGYDVVMAQEMLPYTESHRDQLERELAQAANKREINERHCSGIQVIAYFLVAENVTTIWVYDERVNSGVEFEVPKDRVGDYFEHPFSHKDANLPDMRDNDE